MTKYAQGFFQLKNPEKYVGKSTPKYRSSWEFAVMSMCDNNPSILQWASEALHINYRNPFTNRNTIYVPDFFVLFMDAGGKTHGELWEVKPTKETSLQEAGRSKRAQAAAILNMAKWEAARAYCKAQNLNFRIITEHDLWINGKK
ncbi:MAG TPA: TnsA endonuclease N-terminal domain-containing protein [Methanosarcina sp.]|nr:TnsA endonuclease N-terminal domain-containing protein [Methanosarcina sp.]